MKLAMITMAVLQIGYLISGQLHMKKILLTLKQANKTKQKTTIFKD